MGWGGGRPSPFLFLVSPRSNEGQGGGKKGGQGGGRKGKVKGVDVLSFHPCGVFSGTWPHG